MYSNSRAAKLAVLTVVVAVTLVAVAETRKELHFSVGPGASISITNPYGPISVKPALGNEIIVTAILHSDKVEIDQSQSGNRVDVISHLLAGSDRENGRVDYDIQVPSDTNITLHSTTGPLHAEKLQGDVNVEGATAVVDVRDLNNAHVHVRTMNGPVTLTNVRDAHVEITSVSGMVVLTEVTGRFVQVSSGSGGIRYDGDFGSGGEYLLTSHTGDIDAVAPAYASIDVSARSVQGQVINDFPLQPKHSTFATKVGSAFSGTMGKAASSVKLLSFSGKIHLRKR
jgi:DUF4097 and DUF4098 domain-containing protein YvlB